MKKPGKIALALFALVLVAGFAVVLARNRHSSTWLLTFERKGGIETIIVECEDPPFPPMRVQFPATELPDFAPRQINFYRFDTRLPFGLVYDADFTKRPGMGSISHRGYFIEFHPTLFQINGKPYPTHEAQTIVLE